jgi:hypothetical protein
MEDGWKNLFAAFQMKKFFAGILAFLYLSTSMGASIHLHYCMGKFISWGLINHESKNCEYCGMAKNSGPKGSQIAKKSCCSDEHKELKTDRDQKAALGEFEFLKLLPDASALHFLTLPEFPVSSNLLARPTANAPPVMHAPPVFLRNCNFRI